LGSQSFWTQGLIAGNLIVVVGELIKMVMHRNICSMIKLRCAERALNRSKLALDKSALLIKEACTAPS